MKLKQKLTAVRVKETSGTPSFIFHILAEPSVNVDTKNSESKLMDKFYRNISIMHVSSQS